MNMTIDEKIDHYKETLDIFEDPLERYSYLMEQGEVGNAFPEEFRIDEFKVSGCVSMVSA